MNIKNWKYYFCTDRIDFKNFGAKLLKFDKKEYEFDLYCICYVAVKKFANCKNINSVNPLYLMIDETIDHFEEKNENKYLVLDDADETKEVSKKFRKLLKK